MYRSKLPKPVYFDRSLDKLSWSFSLDQSKVLRPVLAAWICTRKIHFLRCYIYFNFLKIFFTLEGGDYLLHQWVRQGKIPLALTGTPALLLHYLLVGTDFLRLNQFFYGIWRGIYTCVHIGRFYRA